MGPLPGHALGETLMPAAQTRVMANVIVNDNHLTYGGVGYFRGHAEEVELGSIGEKRTPLTKMNYLEVKDRIPAPKIATAKSTKVDIDFSKTSKSAFGAIVTAIIGGAPVELNGDATFEKLKKFELYLVKFSVMNNQMRDAANAAPDRLRSLAGWGGDARIAHQVFVVLEATVATKFDNNVSVDLSVGAKGLSATLSGSSTTSSSSVVPIAAGTCFAYLLAKIDWNKGKTKIEDLDDDQWSFS
jgi:hypothetical protein